MSKYFLDKIIPSLSAPIMESKKSEIYNPKKVTKIDKKIANIIDWAINNEAFFLLFAPKLLPIKVFVPAVNPTPIAIIIK